jgi:excinuclease ABC subunit C
VADPLTYRPAPGVIPDAPGVYRFRDSHGRVIYVGKAKSLRSRLSSYFQDLAALHPRTQAMVTCAAGVDWVVVASEVEALQLEYTWIKEFDPHFNVRYRDDKSYPYLAVTVSETYPRITVMRGAKRKGVRYFGPYPQAWAIRDTVDLLLRVFPARTCSVSVFRRAERSGRPCLLGDIGKCAAPCVGRVTAEEHREIVEDFCAFIAGRTSGHVKRLEKDMAAAAAELDYERAARRRDDVAALRRVMERTAVVLGDGANADVIGLAEDELEAAVQVFHVRAGSVRGQRGFVVEKVSDISTAELVEQLIIQLYGDEATTEPGGATGMEATVPPEVLVPVLPQNAKIVTEWLSERAGRMVNVRVPERGAKVALQATVTENARQDLVRHKISRTGDLTKRGQALAEIADALELPEAPLRIECIDISNLQGTDVVASLVVFEDGLPRRSDYRRFIIKDVEGQDDVRSVAEVVTRRFQHSAVEEVEESGPVITGRRPPRFAYPPQLLVIDGGRPQVAAAAAALNAVGVTGVPLVGLAKRLEEVWRPGEDSPLILSRTSEGLYLLQRIRDEAHRFAITFHRERRAKRAVASELDGIPGLGPKRRAALLKKFGSVPAIRRAAPSAIAALPGFGPALAHRVLVDLGPVATGVNVTTGEMLEPELLRTERLR